MAAPRWRDVAACRGRNPEQFHPDEGDLEGQAVAPSICAGCPVVEPCLALALTLGRAVQGVWGHTTTAQRREMGRRAS